MLWIHFFVNAPFGFALGFDKETPGLMARTPRPRGESALTRPLMITVGLVGLAMTVGLLALIQLGKIPVRELHHRVVHRPFTAFALMMIVAAIESRSETDTVFTLDTFESKQKNWVALGEFFLAVLSTQLDALRRILGTTDLSMKQFRWALIPAVVLLLLWELGKLVARRRIGTRAPALAPA